VAARNHGETRRELERLSSSAGPFQIHQPDDLGFLLGLPGYFLRRRRRRPHQVEPRDYRGYQREQEQTESSLDRSTPADHSGSRHPDDFSRTVL